MRIRYDLAERVKQAIQLGQSAGNLPAFDIPEIVVEKPRDVKFGDYACPSAMQMARLARMAPKRIAETIVTQFAEVDYIDQITVVEPGFINFRLSIPFLQNQVEQILAEGYEFGSFDLGAGKRAQVEFVSANPTGPLTVGRGRGGVMGDTLARAMEAAGYR